MTPRGSKPPANSRFAAEWSVAALFLATLVAGTFFQGNDGELLVFAQVLLVFCLGIILWTGYERGWTIPLSSLTAAVTLYWLWLALTLMWSRVPYYSGYLFWWMGSFPLAFWLLTLTSQWTIQLKLLKLGVVVLAVTLAIAGIVEYYLRGTGPQLMFLNKNAFGGLMNLVAIPTSAWLMTASVGNKQKRLLTFFAAVAVFVLTYAMNLTNGRGALVGFILAALMLGAALYRHLPKRALWVFAVIAALSIALPQLHFGSESTGAVGRFAAVTDSQGSGWQRWLIWRGSWELLTESPWWGIGLGVYALAWQRFRHPDDGSAGVLAHNDYLQMWIEAGLPGLILFVSILVAASWTVLSVLKRAGDRVNVRAEAVGLYAGVFAVSVHSLVDFNFYVVPTLIMCGLMLARLQALRSELEPVLTGRVRPSRWLTPFGYRALVMLALAFPLLYFFSITMAVFKTREGVSYAKAGELDLAELSLLRAAQLNPTSDDVLMTQADLYRFAIKKIPENSSAERKKLFDLARGLLDEASRLNRFRLQTYVVRAYLYFENPQFLHGDPIAQTRAVFDQALAVNPRSLEVRYGYARYLIAQGLPVAAKEVLESGLRHLHAQFPRFIPYYALTATLRRQSGDDAGAAILEARIRELAPSNQEPAGTK